MNFSLPPLGISLVRSLGESFTERDLRECAEKIIESGLRDAGYEYVIIPDTWCARRRCPTTDSLVCDTDVLPSTLSGAAEYLHSVGLKLGLVMSLGSRSASDRPGTFDHEWSDIEYFDKAGVDYIGFDTSRLPARVDLQTPLRRLCMAVRNASRDIFYATYTTEDIHLWARSAGINSFCLRSFADAFPAREPDISTAGYSADFCFESCGDISVCDTEQLRTQLITAAAVSSPIIIDCDVRTLTAEQLALVSNRDILSVCRDEEVRPARCLSDGVYIKPLDNCTYAIAFVNSTDAECVRTFTTFDFGLTWNAEFVCVATDIFTGDSETFTDGLECTLAAGCSSMYLMKLKER